MERLTVRNTPATKAHAGKRSIGGMRYALVAAVLVGCAYKPGSFAGGAKQFSGQRTTVGCLDLAIARRPELASSAVLEYQFGNRCDRAEVVDLAYVHVVGRTADGAEHRLAPYDPNGELLALELGGRLAGAEAISYPHALPLEQICVDAASVAQQQPERWVCFARVDQSGEPYLGQGEQGQVAADSAGATPEATP